MLTRQELEQNQQRFDAANVKYNIFTDELKKFLGDDFYMAPASTMLSLHNAFPGGLLDHELKICKYMVLKNKMLPTEMRVPEESIMRVAFLCEIGKTFLYKLCESEWHRKNQGKMYEFNENLVSMRVGERSVYYAIAHDVKLTDEEYSAILSYDKNPDDKMVKYHNSTLGSLLKSAVEFAIMEEQFYGFEKTK